jgi:hypothetical protein
VWEPFGTLAKEQGFPEPVMTQWTLLRPRCIGTGRIRTQLMNKSINQSPPKRCPHYSTLFEGLLLLTLIGDETQVQNFEPQSKWQSREWRHATSPRNEKFKSGKTMAKVLWESKAVLVNFVPIGTKVNFDLYWKFLSQVKCQKRYLSITNPGHIQVCIPQRPLGNSVGRFCRNYSTVLISHLQIFNCLFARKTTHEDNIMRYRRQFRRSFVVVAKEWVQLLSGPVQGWKKTRKKIGEVLKQNQLFKWVEWSYVKFSYLTRK